MCFVVIALQCSILNDWDFTRTYPNQGRPNHSHDNKRSNGEAKEGMLPVALKQSSDYEGMLFATKESENALAPAAFTPLVNSKSVMLR